MKGKGKAKHGKSKHWTVPSVDRGLLLDQIKAVLESDMEEDLKAGLHELLGTLDDQLREDGIAVFISSDKV